VTEEPSEATAAETAAPGEPAAARRLEAVAAARDELATLDRELAEIELLMNQARTEAARHEARRAQAEERLRALRSAGEDTTAAFEQLVTLTRRAAIMESQIDVLEGKQRALRRFRETLARHLEALARQLEELGDGEAGGSTAATTPVDTPTAVASGGAEPVDLDVLPPAMSRMVLAAQEDLRREIARAMHDGPAQSLTNIVLQAQIVERLMDRDPAAARREANLLVGMVQQTLEATKSFIFDVRPMVLDDLGLLPTLRRAARDRGRRAQIPVEFDSAGADRRLPIDVESGLFRMIDQAVAAYLAARPERVAVRLDWSDRFEATVEAVVPEPAAPEVPAERPEPQPERGRGRRSAAPAELPPALAALIEERRSREAALAEEASARYRLPERILREIRSRAAPIGVVVEIIDAGRGLRFEAAFPSEPS
jgi:two-component system sensor histidine kinase DegS